MDKERLGQRIREERKRHRYTLEALATKARIGSVYLSEIERGLKAPSLGVLVEIVNAFEDVSLDYLLRDFSESGKGHALNEVTEKMVDLTPSQIRMISDVVEVMISNFEIQKAERAKELEEW